MDWRLIDSGPRDGSQVLLRIKDAVGGHVVLQGWFEAGLPDRCWYDIYDCPIDPTHWMPLPAEPLNS